MVSNLATGKCFWVSEQDKLVCPGSIFPKGQAGKLISFLSCSRIKLFRICRPV